MPDPAKYLLELPSRERPAPFNAPEKVHPDIHWYNRHRATNRIFHSVNGIEAIVIHATAGGSSQSALSWWKQPRGAKASAHWIIPGEDEDAHGEFAWAVVYEALAAWHVRNSAFHPQLENKNKVNHWSLGVEIVNRQNSSDPYSDWQIKTTALLVRYCWAKYPNLKYVFSHAFIDPTRRTDPGDNFDWAQFQALALSSKNDPYTDAIVAATRPDAPVSELGRLSGAPCRM